MIFGWLISQYSHRFMILAGGCTVSYLPLGKTQGNSKELILSELPEMINCQASKAPGKNRDRLSYTS